MRSDLETEPTVIPYTGRDMRGAVAQFSSAPAEFLRVDNYIDTLEYNWTTDLNANKTADILHEILPKNIRMGVWHSEDNQDLYNDDIEKIQAFINLEPTIRLIYLVEFDEVALTGLFVVWRVNNHTDKGPYRIGAQQNSAEASLTKNLIARTATDNIRKFPNLLDTLIQKTKI